MPCPSCAAIVPDHVETCLACGKFIRSGTRDERRTQVTRRGPTKRSESPGRPRKFRALGLLTGLVLRSLVLLLPGLLTLGGVAYYFCGNVNYHRHVEGFNKIAASLGRR